MKKIRILSLVLSLLLVVSAMALPAQAAAIDHSVQNGCHSVDASLQLSEEGKLVETSKAVIIYDLISDTMIYTWNPDAKIYPASMVKLMTALLALENAELTDRVAVTKRALSYVEIGSVSAGLVAGEELSLEDLLNCMMAASANDAATVIAEYIGGTQETFIKMMNQRAAELGCTGTNYANAHGSTMKITILPPGIFADFWILQWIFRNSELCSAQNPIPFPPPIKAKSGRCLLPII